MAQSFIVKYPNMVEGLMMIGTCPYGTDYYSKSDIFWLKQTEWMLKLFPDKLLRNIISKMCGATSEGRRSMLKMLEGYEKRTVSSHVSGICWVHTRNSRLKYTLSSLFGGWR